MQAHEYSAIGRFNGAVQGVCVQWQLQVHAGTLTLQRVSLRESVQQLAHPVQVDAKVVPRLIPRALRPKHIGQRVALHPSPLAGQVNQQAGRQAGRDAVVGSPLQSPFWYVK